MSARTGVQMTAVPGPTPKDRTKKDKNITPNANIDKSEASDNSEDFNQTIEASVLPTRTAKVG